MLFDVATSYFEVQQ